jgi:hypothetical protein
MNRLLTLLALCFLSSPLWAQNFQPGYIAMHNGDTLNGHVQLKPAAEGSTFISVTSSPSAVPNVYPLSLVKGFRLSNSKDIYSKWFVKMDMTYLDKWELTVVNVDSTRWDTVFLKLLYQGKNLSLYTRQDVKERFFIYDNGKMQELIMKWSYPPDFRLPSFEFLARAERRQILAIYRDQLLIYVNQLRDGERLEYQTSIARYNEKDLKRIIKALDEQLK